MLCGLGAAVLAADAARRWQHVAALLTAFIGVLVSYGPDQLPDASLVGAATAGAAALRLFAPRYSVLTAACGGALSASWVALLNAQGLPVAPAIAAAAGLTGVSAGLARRRSGFAPQAVLDEGLLAVLVLALAVALLPTVLEGWQAAATLNVGGAPSAQTFLPVWAWVVVAGSSALGAVYTVWSRR